MRIIFIYILCVKFRICFQDTVNGGHFQQNKKMNSVILFNRDNIGPKMCIRECLRIKNCNGINFHKDFLNCELLSVSNSESQLISRSGFSYSNITYWTMEADSCWPSKPCPEKTKCRPLQSNGHVCLQYGLLNEIFRENISSPGFPVSYHNQMNETWKFEVVIGNIVAVRFTYFDLEHCCDYVKVYDGVVSADTLLGSLNTNVVPQEVRSTKHCMVIIMTTDGSVVKAGFSADIYEIIS